MNTQFIALPIESLAGGSILIFPAASLNFAYIVLLPAVPVNVHGYVVEVSSQNGVYGIHLAPENIGLSLIIMSVITFIILSPYI